MLLSALDSPCASFPLLLVERNDPSHGLDLIVSHPHMTGRLDVTRATIDSRTAQADPSRALGASPWKEGLAELQDCMQQWNTTHIK